MMRELWTQYVTDNPQLFKPAEVVVPIPEPQDPPGARKYKLTTASVRKLKRERHETHASVCPANTRKTSAGSSHGWDRPAVRNHGAWRGISRHDAASHQAVGRSCIYVPITQDGKVVDSEGFLDLEDE
jgi:hypothetical protein